MQIQPIAEAAFNQSLLALTAMRQELLLYREELPKAQEGVRQLKARLEKLEEEKNALDAELVALRKVEQEKKELTTRLEKLENAITTGDSELNKLIRQVVQNTSGTDGNLDRNQLAAAIADLLLPCEA